jgi:uncharacterized protein HemY
VADPVIATVLTRALWVISITFSGIAIGGAAGLVLIHIRDALAGDRDAIAFALARIGFIIIVFLLAKLVVRLSELQPTGDTWWYVTALVLTGIGYSWLAFGAFREKRREKTT